MSRSGLGQRRHPGSAGRRAVRAVRLRAVTDVRGDEGREPRARRPRRARGLFCDRHYRRHACSRAVVVRHRGTADGGARLRGAADDSPGRAGPQRAHHADGHLRAVRGDRERPASVRNRQHPRDRRRAVPGDRLLQHRLDPDRVPARGHLRGRRGGAAGAAVLPVAGQVRPPDPCRRRRQGSGAACGGRLPARVRHRGGDRVRHRRAGRHRLWHVLPAQPHHWHRHDPAVRVRGCGDRRARLAVGNPARRRGPGRGPADRCPDQYLRRDPCRVPRVPRRARRAPAGPYLPEGAVVSLATETTARSAEKFRVTRSQRNVAWTGAGALIVVVVLAMFPYIVYSGTTAVLVQAFIVLTLASMWNLLAGYAGLVSVGQQAFVGLGAYFVLILAINGTSPFAALPVAAIGCGVAALPLWWLVSRLRTGYFAIATWVLAATVMLIIEKFSSIGGGTGMPLPGLAGLDPALLTAYTYWAGLAVTVLALAGIYLLLRGRIG